MTTHELKCWPEFFAPTATGEKLFEIRNNDRNFQVGDLLRLREYVQAEDRYTGKELVARVTYLTSFAQTGYHVVMSIRVLAER